MRIFPLVLVLVMLVFTSCAQATDTAATVPDKKSATTQASAAEEAAESEEPVTVVFYINNGSTSGDSSNKDELEALHDWFLDQINVDFQFIIPPVGSEQAEEKLNLILASG